MIQYEQHLSSCMRIHIYIHIMRSDPTIVYAYARVALECCPRLAAHSVCVPAPPSSTSQQPSGLGAPFSFLCVLSLLRTQSSVSALATCSRPKCVVIVVIVVVVVVVVVVAPTKKCDKSTLILLLLLAIPALAAFLLDAALIAAAAAFTAALSSSAAAPGLRAPRCLIASHRCVAGRAERAQVAEAAAAPPIVHRHHMVRLPERALAHAHPPLARELRVPPKRPVSDAALQRLRRRLHLAW
mmetsp:Transcript_9909/g.32513  ORF Transcript_9909/g.32513 Transcript_9909/m.32513 type:complete len:241 (-) Transcript_9909:80-802(-)